MRRYPTSASALVWAAMCELLLVRTADAHLHLCFDGQEPPRSFHVDDPPGDHEDHDSGGGHQDQDVETSTPALAKKESHAADGEAPPLVAVLLLLTAPERGPPPDIALQDPAPSLPDLFLQLLRGPPA